MWCPSSDRLPRLTQPIIGDEKAIGYRTVMPQPGGKGLAHDVWVARRLGKRLGTINEGGANPQVRVVLPYGAAHAGSGTSTPRPAVLTCCAAPEPHAAAVPCPRWWCGPMKHTGSTQAQHDRARGAVA